MEASLSDGSASVSSSGGSRSSNGRGGAGDVTGNTVFCANCGTRYSEGKAHHCETTVAVPGTPTSSSGFCSKCGAKKGFAHRCKTVSSGPKKKGAEPSSSSSAQGRGTMLLDNEADSLLHAYGMGDGLDDHFIPPPSSGADISIPGVGGEHDLDSLLDLIDGGGGGGGSRKSAPEEPPKGNLHDRLAAMEMQRPGKLVRKPAPPPAPAPKENNSSDIESGSPGSSEKERAAAQARRKAMVKVPFLPSLLAIQNPYQTIF